MDKERVRKRLILAGLSGSVLVILLHIQIADIGHVAPPAFGASVAGQAVPVAPASSEPVGTSSAVAGGQGAVVSIPKEGSSG